MSDGIMIMKFNGDMVTANLPNLQRAMHMGAKKGTLDAAMKIMRLSQEQVPHDEGSLQNSGTVEVMPNGDAVLGYHEPYAARLHEHPEYQFQKGRKGKYIEDPINTNIDKLNLIFEKNMGEELNSNG